MRLLLVVAGLLTDSAGRVLVAQRPPGKALAGLWEFPGGKIEAGETPEAALIRELAEELAVTVAATDLEPFSFASHGYDDFHLLMPCWQIRHWQGVPVGQQGQVLCWADAATLAGLPMPPADLPLVAALAQRATIAGR